MYYMIYIMDDVTPTDYIFKKVEELVKGDKYMVNDKIYVKEMFIID
jgi:hypothetical protein